MRIGLIADSHDRLPALTEFLRRFSEAKVGMVLHAGDFCSPFAFKPIREAGLALAAVFGRNDGDHEGLRAQAASCMGAELYESPHSMDVAGHHILLVHDIGEVNKRSVTSHQFVIHGCSHQVEMKTRGSTLMINPGEACGWLYGTPSAAILDLNTKQVEFLTLDAPEWRAGSAVSA
jgi:putative phosphoesterase